MNDESFNHQNHIYDLLYINYINSFFTFQTFQIKKKNVLLRLTFDFLFTYFYMQGFLTDVTLVRVFLFEKQINHGLFSCSTLCFTIKDQLYYSIYVQGFNIKAEKCQAIKLIFQLIYFF